MFNYVYLNILQQCLLCLIVMRPFPKKSHCALHPVCLSVPPFFSPVPTANSKTESSTMLKLSSEVIHVRSNWQNNFEVNKSKANVSGNGNMKIVFSAYLREKCIDSRKTKTKMTTVPCCTFRLLQCRAKMCTLRDNWTTMFDCADVLFQVNGTSARCCAAVKQTWRAAYRVPILQQPLFVIDCKQLYKI